jgi:hypothetical protein
VKNGAGGVHDQLWQNSLWKETEESDRVDYRGNVGENDSALSLDPVTHRESALLSSTWACGALPWHGRGRRFDPDQVHQIS